MKPMRKRKSMTKTALVALLAGLLLVTACGQKPTEADPSAAGNPGTEAQAPGASTPGNAGNTNEPAKNEPVKTAKGSEVFEKALNASAKLESFKTVMTMKQNMDINGQKMDMATKMDMDMIVKPKIAFKQAMEMTVAGQATKMDMYYTEEGLFLRESTSGQWMKMPAEALDQAQGLIQQDQMDLAKQMEKLKQFADDMQVSESADSYTIKLVASGEKFNDFIKSELDSLTNGQMNEMMSAAMSGVNVKSLEYTYVVDKKNYYPTSMIMDMAMEMDVQGQKINMVQNMEGTYSSYNSIKSITVPAEALQAATAPGGV